MIPTKGQTFHRPLGGGIEFGEPAESAVRRELREELGVELLDVRRLGVLESIFRCIPTASPSCSARAENGCHRPGSVPRQPGWRLVSRAGR